MTEPNDSLKAELERITAPELANYTALANIVYSDYHGQEDGEDPELDKNTIRLKSARDGLYKAFLRWHSQALQDDRKALREKLLQKIRSNHLQPISQTERQNCIRAIKTILGGE